MSGLFTPVSRLVQTRIVGSPATTKAEAVLAAEVKRLAAKCDALKVAIGSDGKSSAPSSGASSSSVSAVTPASGLKKDLQDVSAEISTVDASGLKLVSLISQHEEAKQVVDRGVAELKLLYNKLAEATSVLKFHEDAISRKQSTQKAADAADDAKLITALQLRVTETKDEIKAKEATLGIRNESQQLKFITPVDPNSLYGKMVEIEKQRNAITVDHRHRDKLVAKEADLRNQIATKEAELVAAEKDHSLQVQNLKDVKTESDANAVQSMNTAFGLSTVLAAVSAVALFAFSRFRNSQSAA